MDRYRICLSLYGTTDEIVEAISSTKETDLFEVRLDMSAPVDCSRIRSATSKPLVFTAHGRPDLLEQAASYADYLDGRGGLPCPSRQIVSVHTSRGDPFQLWQELHGDYLTKIVMDTEDYGQIKKLLQLDSIHQPNALCFAMGEIGAFSRILSLFHGAPWIYAALPNRLTAPGQLDLEELIEVYKLRRFPAGEKAARVFGIVGNPVSHSLSPKYQNERFASESLPWIYLPFPCKDLESLFRYAPELGISGFSITHPYKEEVLSLVHHRSPEVDLLRSCNTVCFRDGEWHGINTDVIGISGMMEKLQVPVAGSRITILGAGGAARAFAAVVRPQAKDLVVLNRTPAKAQALASQFQGLAGTLDDFGKYPYDLLFNATPVGLSERECPVNPLLLLAGATVVDSIYIPAETFLLKKAKELGCRTINGEVWFFAQAEAQFQWWKQMLYADPKCNKSANPFFIKKNHATKNCKMKIAKWRIT